jgi:hypothetical protein
VSIFLLTLACALLRSPSFSLQNRVACSTHRLLKFSSFLPCLQMIVTINIFLQFTLWGYTLPPRPTREELHQWHSKMGFFMVHKLAVGTILYRTTISPGTIVTVDILSQVTLM